MHRPSSGRRWQRLACIVGADIGPNLINLCCSQDSLPRRHPILAIRDGIDEPRVFVGFEPTQVKRQLAGIVLQLVAMTGGAIILVNALTLCHRVFGADAVKGSDEHQDTDRSDVDSLQHALPISPLPQSSNSLNVHKLPPAGTWARFGSGVLSA